MVATRFFVSGRVQGVFFRGSTQAEAKRLGLRGWAINLDDGRVEVLAVGGVAAIAELAAWLEHGPKLARVVSVASAMADSAEHEDLQDFRTG